MDQRPGRGWPRRPRRRPCRHPAAQVTEQLDLPVRRAPVGRDHEHRDARLDQRDRAVEEVRGGVRIGEDATQLLHLQRPLARRGVLEAAPDDDAPVHRARARRRAARATRRPQARSSRAAAITSGTASRARPSRVRLRRRAPPTAARSPATTWCTSSSPRSRARGRRRDQDVVRGGGERARRVVGDRQRRRALTGGSGDDRDDVGRHPRLADADHERAARRRARPRRPTPPTAWRARPTARSGRRGGTGA